MKFVCFDLETTGLDPNKHVALTAYFYDLYNNKGKEFRILHDGDILVSKKALEVNQLDLRDQSYFVDTELSFGYFIKELNDKQYCFIGWNVDFDIGFIKKYFNGHRYFHIDVMSLWMIYKEKNSILSGNRQIDAAKYFNIEYKAHDAKEDVLTCAQIFKKITGDLVK